MLRRCSKNLQTLYRRKGQSLRFKSTEVPKVCGALSQAAARLNQPRAIIAAHNQVASIHITNPLFEEKDVMTPSFPDSVSEGDVKLDKKVGDSVAADEVVCEVETDKTALPVMAPTHGIIKELYVKDGDTVKAGQKLFRMEVTGAAPAKAAAAPAPKAPQAATPPPPPAAAVPPPAAAVSQASVSSIHEEKDVMTPSFPDSVSEGDVKLDKKVGDSVAADEVVLQVETDKTALPVMAPSHGIIKELYVKDGDTVKAGQKLFRMAVTGAAPAKAAAAPAPEAQQAAAAPPPPAAAVPPPPPAAAVPPPAPRQAPPSAAPISSIPVAAIRHAQAIETATVKVPPTDYSKEIAGTRTEQRVKMNRMRQRIAQRLKDAQNTNAMLTTFNEIDMSGIMAFRKKYLDAFTKKHGVKLGLMSPFVKAAANALVDQPVVNAVIEENEIIYRDYVDISVAVATPKGLVVPVIRNVQTMTYADIELTVAGLAEKARTGKLTIEEMDGGTFTISNGGVFGSLMGTPIINPPQSAILGMHGIFERPIALNGQVVIRPMMYIALTYDHRLVDGREAVMFLRKIKEGVEDPTSIVAGL